MFIIIICFRIFNLIFTSTCCLFVFWKKLWVKILIVPISWVSSLFSWYFFREIYVMLWVFIFLTRRWLAHGLFGEYLTPLLFSICFKGFAILFIAHHVVVVITVLNLEIYLWSYYILCHRALVATWKTTCVFFLSFVSLIIVVLNYNDYRLIKWN